MLSQQVVFRMAADSVIMAYYHRAALWIFRDAMPKIVDTPLTLRWHSFLGCGNEHIVSLFRFYANQYVHFGILWQSRQLIAECVRL